MRRAGILGLALAVTIALGVSLSQAAKAKRVLSQVEISGRHYPPPDFDFHLAGDVHASKNKCERNRAITLYLGNEVVGTDTTDRTGDWLIGFVPVAGGQYVAEVDRKRIGRGDKKLICTADSSPAFDVGT